MSTVPVLIGNAPTTSSTRRERGRAERFGYLIDRGDHLEWHQRRKAELWALPGRDPESAPFAARFAKRAPGAAAQLASTRTPYFVLDGPSLWQLRAGAVGPPPPLRIRFGTRLLATLKVVGIVGIGIGLLALAVMALLSDGGLETGMGTGGSPENGKFNLYLLNQHGGVLGGTGGMVTTTRETDALLARLGARGIPLG